jgi:uncharacterized repeat protein (TIGR01451 family)
MKFHLKDWFFVFLLTSSLLLTTIGIGIAATGRSGGPDYYGYTFNDSHVAGGPTYNWIDIASTGTPCGIEDNIPIGFDFNFYGSICSNVSVANGIIYVNASGGTNGRLGQPIGSSAPHNFIAPFWDDIGAHLPSGVGAVYYKAIGTAPNREFIVQWNKLVPSGYYGANSTLTNTNGITFEAILFEGSNNILFQYKNVTFSNGFETYFGTKDNGGEATVGIEGSGGDGLQYSYKEKVLNSRESILFEFPQLHGGNNLYLSEQAPDSKDNGSSMTYRLYYQNFGNITFNNVILEDQLSDNVEYDSASDNGNYNNSTRVVTWDIGSIESGGNGYRDLTVYIPTNVSVGTVILNRANISTPDPEVRYDDNEANVQTRVTGSILPPNVGVEPNNGGTNTPSVDYNKPITFSYNSSVAATAVVIRINISDGGPDIVDSMTGGPLNWTYNTKFYPRNGSAIVTYTVSGSIEPTESFNIYIDPAGFIYDIDTEERIANASVWLQRPDGNGGWENVPTGESPSVAQPDKNPLLSDVNGMYQWDTLPGSYRVHVVATGYKPADSIVVSIPPPVTNLNVGLDYIEVPPVASFISNVTSGITPLTVSFNDTSTGIPTSWKWYFGDGTNSTDKNPVHTYIKARQYNVTLVANNTIGSNKIKEIDYISVLAPPIAAFSASPINGKAPLTVNFTDKSKGSPNSWIWEFGDGNTSTKQNTTNIYSISKNYTVTLTAINDSTGSNTTTKFNYIKVK